MRQHNAARDISYATGVGSRGGRAVIRLIENATGRLSLIRKAKGYDRDVAQGRDFWQVITERFGLTLNVTGGVLETIPANGPLIIVANHPYGVLDGLMLGRILSERRGRDFRILAHQIFCQSPDLEQVILPISFDETKDCAISSKVVPSAYSLAAQCLPPPDRSIRRWIRLGAPLPPKWWRGRMRR
jgi:hypothetical protein